MKITKIALSLAFLLLVPLLVSTATAQGPRQPTSIVQTAFNYDNYGFVGYADEEHAVEAPAPGVPAIEASAPEETAAPAEMPLADETEFFECEPVSCRPNGPSGLLGSALHGGGGLTAQYIYTGEVFNNMRGGRDTTDATRYTGRFDMLLNGDLDRMGFAPGGEFVLHFQSLHGEGITDDFVGAHQRVSNMDGNPGSGYEMTQLSQYFWKRSVIDDFFTIKLGKIYADSEFALATRGGDFINTSLGWTHTISRFSANPDPSMAAIAYFDLTDTLQFKAGVWDGAPDGQNWGFSGTGDVFSIYEFKKKWLLGCSRLPGDSNVGIWHHNAPVADQADANVTHFGNHGVYWGMSQLIARESLCDDSQGLGTFVQFGWAPRDRNVAQQYWGGGLVYTGLIDCRDADTCGIGIGNMTFSTMGPSRGDETMIELFYKARLTEHITLQPDFQYIASPGGTGASLPDSFLFGLRFQTIL